MIITEIKFDKSVDLLNYLCSWNNGLKGYVFRGHSDEKYELIPSVLRDNYRFLSDNAYPRGKQNSQYEYYQIQHEFKLIREFYKLSDKHGLKVPLSDEIRKSLVAAYDLSFAIKTDNNSEWIPSELLETTALAQHYGIPTRLLDWTYDPFISAYFAASGVSATNGNIVIWCLNAELISFLSNFNANFPVKIVTPPYSDNNNLYAQSGLFTHMTTKFNFNSPNSNLIPVNRTSLEKRLEHFIQLETQDRDKVFIKLILPQSEARDLHLKLINHGYGEARIYPGYKGIANQVMSLHKKE
ncbi:MULTISPECIES: FRG domain-containing protein [unclassified Tatumella]|uniref:FRG domain-containing protein n=1 Tax=unclassified Tatumella TaxID=2649542 RepID=UPI001BB0449D|nr:MULTISPECIES: FRG domain-containing protein [unclassified Tatumella]MBS0878009.1 FRG domain-containing protein [Tatumella sp. JGM82]MBS0891268.1 FRG domain-containing protein [Tatumella sp. JGM94]MBS0902647.1 FRG domain-containing protein [Tatumella sp. JGM100]